MTAPRWTVVVVDDDAPLRALVAETVTAEGGAVLGSGSRVEDAVRLAALHRPDVAVIAATLFGGDGIGAARDASRLALCPVVGLVRRAEAALLSRAIAAGALGILVAPPRRGELGAVLDLAVARSREGRRLQRENDALRRALERRKLVDRAKALLIQRLGLTEREAHRWLQKTAMDTRRPLSEIARMVVAREEPPSRASPPP